MDLSPKDFQCSEGLTDREYCCPYTPMMMAFVLLLLQWVQQINRQFGKKGAKMIDLLH